LTLQYDKVIFMIEDTPGNRSLIGKYIDVYEYPDGQVELRAEPSTAIPYVIYDGLPEVNQGAIVENKRLAHVLQIAQLMQEKRDDRRSISAGTHKSRQTDCEPTSTTRHKGAAQT
jgi:hypothetical protein